LSYPKDCSKSSLNNLLEQFISKGRTRFYLSEFAEESDCPIKEVEDYFIPLMGAGEIEGKLELRCPNCGKDFGLFRRTSDIPKSITCEFCGHKFTSSMEYTEIVLELKKPFFRDQGTFSYSISSEKTQQK
jgi:DNA-directed RNA polymerase subunit RPC12/RpoP